MRYSNKIVALVFSFFLLITTAVGTQISQQDRIFIKIEIKGLACPYCAFGMEKELKKVSGVDNVHIELKEGFAYIDTPTKQKPTKKVLEKIIIDAGFTPGTIIFSEIPFTKGDHKP